MSEEETKQEGKEEVKDKPTGDADKGDKPKATSPIEQADERIKRMEELDKSLGEKVKELGEIESRKMLGGGSQAGQAPAEKAEETNEEYVERVRKAGWRDERRDQSS